MENYSKALEYAQKTQRMIDDLDAQQLIAEIYIKEQNDKRK